MSEFFSFYKPLSAVKTILYAGLVAGVLDAIAGVIVYFIYFELNPLQVLQFIASGVYGPTAINGGAFMVLAGTFFHFLIAFVCAAVFFYAFEKITVLRKNAAASGLLFGFAVWLVMNLLVLPNSNIPKAPFDAGLAVIGIVWHMVLVGWPIAAITKSYLARTPSTPSSRAKVAAA